MMQVKEPYSEKPFF